MEKGKVYKLGEICEIRSGKTPDTRKKEYWCFHKEKCDCVYWYTGKDITQRVLETERKITQLAVKENKQPLTTTNSILFFHMECLPFYSGVSGFSFNQIISVLEPNLNYITSPNYLYYLLLANQKILRTLRTGTAQLFTKQVSLINFPVFLPPLSKQTQILSKFQIVYNSRIFRSEIVYNDNLLKIIKTFLKLMDYYFLKNKDRNSQIKIKDHFQLIAGKTPYASLYKNNKELYELVKKKSRQPGTIKWVNSGILTNCYFLTENTEPNKLINKELVSLCKLNYGIDNSVLIPGVYFDIDKITWNQTKDYIIGQEILNLNYLKDEKIIKNATLFFALRSQTSKIIHNCCYGSAVKNLDFYLFKNYNLNWVSNPKKQKIFFTILNSKLAKIKDLHRKIKDLLLLKYFGKK